MRWKIQEEKHRRTVRCKGEGGEREARLKEGREKGAGKGREARCRREEKGGYM